MFYIFKLIDKLLQTIYHIYIFRFVFNKWMDNIRRILIAKNKNNKIIKFKK